VAILVQAPLVLLTERPAETAVVLVMAPAILWLLLAPHGAVARPMGESSGITGEVVLLQTGQPYLVPAAGNPELATRNWSNFVTMEASPTPATDDLGAMEWVNHIMGQMEKVWTHGFWAAFNFPNLDMPACGKSTFKELQMNIPLWKREHPHIKDPFCHFQNAAMWFPGAYRSSDYSKSGRGVQHAGSPAGPGFMCDSKGFVGGPEVSLHYDAGTITWNHVRNCIDVVDDPYCYSLGWLKGQNLDGALITNASAWNELAKQECAKIKEEFAFDDEEVTVGRHVFSTPLYFRQTWNSLKGTGSPITKRLHKEHVYTKCLLGDGAPTEMAYCYYKACLLPGNRIGHTSECDYDSST